MHDFIIFADTGCDILPEKLREWDVKCIDLTFRREGESREYTQADIPTKQFYDNMRAGAVYRTAAANAERQLLRMRVKRSKGTVRKQRSASVKNA